MNQPRRLLLYLLLNVVLSACTILTVLWIWDRPGKPLQGLLTSSNRQEAATPVNGAGEVPAVGATQQYSEGMIIISTIIGAGSAQDEKVTLERRGTGELSLAGWRLEDSDGNAFVFPDLTLYQDGAIIVHSGAGINTVVDLYWNQNRAIWQEGETATLIDPRGKVQTTYRIP